MPDTAMVSPNRLTSPSMERTVSAGFGGTTGAFGVRVRGVVVRGVVVRAAGFFVAAVFVAAVFVAGVFVAEASAAGALTAGAATAGALGAVFAAAAVPVRAVRVRGVAGFAAADRPAAGFLGTEAEPGAESTGQPYQALYPTPDEVSQNDNKTRCNPCIHKLPRYSLFTAQRCVYEQSPG